jgi:hypothetical protein
MSEEKENVEESNGMPKEITLTPALTDLLRPTTKLLGVELRDLRKKKLMQ